MLSSLPALTGMFLMFLLASWLSLAEACRIEEPMNPAPHVLYKHISGSCTLEERSALSLTAEELFIALQMGKSVDLLGVVVKGNLSFDRLPLIPIHEYRFPSSGIKETLKQRGIKEVRVIRGAITIRESWFPGILETKLREGAVVISGPVNMDNTKFERSVDFSKTVFLDSANFSGMTIGYEAFFIGAHFEDEANFQSTAFGVHTRFHKAYFAKNVTFEQAIFKGLAEFLEVVFAKTANFSHAIFKHGTGFSGTQFRGPLDFSHALFEREVYFRFASFQHNASFRSVDFRKVADFTNIQFVEKPDFSSSSFEVPPVVGDSKLTIENQKDRKIGSPTSQIVIFVGLFLIVVLFIRTVRKRAE